MDEEKVLIALVAVLLVFLVTLLLRSLISGFFFDLIDPLINAMSLN